MFGVRPHQRHRAAGGPAEKQFPLRDILAVPDLLRDQTAGTRGGLQCREQPPRFAGAAGGKLVMRALAGQQRPQPANADAVERRAVFVLDRKSVV